MITTLNKIREFSPCESGWVKLFSHALISTQKGHSVALEELIKDIEFQKSNEVRY